MTDRQKLELAIARYWGIETYYNYDVFIIAGQSNASGRGDNNQSYTHPTLVARLFGNDYIWHELTDPTDVNTNQRDAVSSDVLVAGSAWPLLATAIMAVQGRPVAFVPCAKGSSSIVDWQPGANHEDTTTMYGSMIHRARQIFGTLRGVLWWQGEQDALNGMDTATYNAWLDALANAVEGDLGINLMPCKLQFCTGLDADDQAAINAAIGAAWGDNPNVAIGPDLSGLVSDDTVHLKSDVNLSAAAALWWAAIDAAYYP